MYNIAKLVTKMPHNKYFNGNKYLLCSGRWFRTTRPQTQLSHDVWNFYHPNNVIKMEEDIHHKNGDPSDDRIENLEKMEHGKHTALHLSGGKHSNEHNRKHGKSMKTHYEYHPETKQQISDSLKGHKHSEKTKKKMSESTIEFYEEHPEAIQKMKERTGKKSSAWKGGEIKLTCEQCGKIFEVGQSRKNIAKFCSYECMGESRKKEKVILICQQCGKEFKVIISRKEDKFCSRKCYYESKKKNHL